MPSSFDYGWSTGPFGPAPFIILSQTDADSERNYILGSRCYTGSGVFHILGMVVQYGNASGPTAPPKFRRGLMQRIGSRGVQTWL